MENNTTDTAKALREKHKKRKRKSTIKGIVIIALCVVIIAIGATFAFIHFSNPDRNLGASSPQNAATDYVKGMYSLNASRVCNVLDVPMKRTIIHDISQNGDMGFSTDVDVNDSVAFEEMYSHYCEFCKLNNLMMACVSIKDFNITDTEIVNKGSAKFKKYVRYAFTDNYSPETIEQMARVSLSYSFTYSSDVADSNKNSNENKAIFCAKRDGKWYVSFDD